MEVAQCETNAENEEEEDDMDKKVKIVAEGKTKRKIKWVLNTSADSHVYSLSVQNMTLFGL